MNRARKQIQAGRDSRLQRVRLRGVSSHLDQDQLSLELGPEEDGLELGSVATLLKRPVYAELQSKDEKHNAEGVLYSETSKIQHSKEVADYGGCKWFLV